MIVVHPTDARRLLSVYYPQPQQLQAFCLKRLCPQLLVFKNSAQFWFAVLLIIISKRSRRKIFLEGETKIETVFLDLFKTKYLRFSNCIYKKLNLNSNIEDEEILVSLLLIWMQVKCIKVWSCMESSIWRCIVSDVTVCKMNTRCLGCMMWHFPTCTYMHITNENIL